jgi:hypothetical protein
MTDPQGVVEETAPAGEELAKHVGEEPAGKTGIPDELEPLVLKRIQAATVRAQKEERARIAAEAEAAKMSDTEKAIKRANDLEKANAALTAQNVINARKLAVRDAAEEIGYVPASFVRDALDAIPLEQDEFDAPAIAKKARDAFLASVERETGGAQQAKRPVARTGGAIQGGTDYTKWTPDQASEHAKTLKPSDAYKFWESYGRAHGVI